jgi:hypothetical protein
MIFDYELQDSLYYLYRDIYHDVSKEQIVELYNTLLKVYLTDNDYYTFQNYIQEHYVVNDEYFVLREYDDGIYVDPDNTIDILYGLYYVSTVVTPTNIRNMDIANILLGMTQFLSDYSDYDITDLCSLLSYNNEFSRYIHYEYMVINILRSYCNNKPFTQNQILDDIANNDLICCRNTYDLDQEIDQILMNFGCYKNCNGYYIYLA